MWHFSPTPSPVNYKSKLFFHLGFLFRVTFSPSALTPIWPKKCLLGSLCWTFNVQCQLIWCSLPPWLRFHHIFSQLQSLLMKRLAFIFIFTMPRHADAHWSGQPAKELLKERCTQSRWSIWQENFRGENSRGDFEAEVECVEGFGGRHCGSCCCWCIVLLAWSQAWESTQGEGKVRGGKQKGEAGVQKWCEIANWVKDAKGLSESGIVWVGDRGEWEAGRRLSFPLCRENHTCRAAQHCIAWIHRHSQKLDSLTEDYLTLKKVNMVSPDLKWYSVSEFYNDEIKVEQRNVVLYFLNHGNRAPRSHAECLSGARRGAPKIWRSLSSINPHLKQSEDMAGS